VFVAICKVCGFVTYSKSYAALRRNIILHYAKHVCENVSKKYVVSRGTCVKAVWDKAVENDYYIKYFDVREVR
jgi:hypothetical protein